MILVVLLMAAIKRSKKLFRQFIILGLVIGISALVISALKPVFNRERPFYVHPGIEKLSTGGGPSFPSGHTVESFAIAMAFAVLFRQKKITIPLFLWALFVAYTRIALGVHYPSDVLGGIVIGMLTGWGISRALFRWVDPDGVG